MYFQSRIAKLGPAYMNCDETQSSCVRRKADPRRGCPNCEFTIQYGFFKKELEEELRKLPRSTREGADKWPTEYLLKVLSDVATLSGSVKKGRKGKNWSVVTSTLVSVYRDEVTKKQVIDNFNSMPQDNIKSGPMLIAED